jgi:hypothetical protein
LSRAQRSGQQLPTDRHISTRCPTCVEEQTRSEGEFYENDETVYTCTNGCQPILVIGAFGELEWPGRGYRLGEFVLRNPADLHVTLRDQAGRPLAPAVLLPASPAALAPLDEAP